MTTWFDRHRAVVGWISIAVHMVYAGAVVGFLAAVVGR